MFQELGIQLSPSVPVAMEPKVVQQPTANPEVSKEALDALFDQGIELSDILQMQQQIMEKKLVFSDSGIVKAGKKRTMYVTQFLFMLSVTIKLLRIEIRKPQLMLRFLVSQIKRVHLIILKAIGIILMD